MKGSCDFNGSLLGCIILDSNRRSGLRPRRRWFASEWVEVWESGELEMPRAVFEAPPLAPVADPSLDNASAGGSECL